MVGFTTLHGTGTAGAKTAICPAQLADRIVNEYADDIERGVRGYF
jgi:hypothetical protein